MAVLWRKNLHLLYYRIVVYAGITEWVDGWRGWAESERGLASERVSYSPVKNGHCSILAKFFSSINQRIRLSFKKIFIVTCREMIITIRGAPPGQCSTKSMYIYIYKYVGQLLPAQKRLLIFCLCVFSSVAIFTSHKRRGMTAWRRLSTVTRPVSFSRH